MAGPGADDRSAGDALDELILTTSLLRESCAWDRAQTHASLRRHLLEEAYEALDALDRLGAASCAPLGRDVAYEDLREELGDVLFQVVFHAAIAGEAQRFDLAGVIDGVRHKLEARHPAIFGPGSGGVAASATSSGSEDSWEAAKVTEKGRASVMDGIPAALPALTYASKVVAKAPVAAPDALVPRTTRGAPADEAALGAELLEIVVAAGQAGFDAEAALRHATRKLEHAVREAEESQGSGPSPTPR